MNEKEWKNLYIVNVNILIKFIGPITLKFCFLSYSICNDEQEAINHVLIDTREYTIIHSIISFFILF